MTERGYAVITGASSGIGAEFARAYGKQGFGLVLCSRRKIIPDDIPAGTDIRYVCADLSGEEGCETLMEEVRRIGSSGGSIEVLVNCAGFGLAGAFSDTDTDRELEMIDLNIRAVHILMKEMLAIFRARGRGTILNVASSAGLFPGGPYFSTYYATKSYVCSLTKAVAEEQREEKSGIYIACLCPGPVDTEFNNTANVRFALKGISAAECVSYAMRQMKKKRTVIIPGLSIRAAVFFAGLVPDRFLMPVIARQQKRKSER
ncbi:MAG: SDR family NAD(P)-dependent oxidoreductase [Lachnospiraceae bacterium]|nr:SDR family NAD(P)-dependent oxidoreductase [Lachnospiraceae bacterium]